MLAATGDSGSPDKEGQSPGCPALVEGGGHFSGHSDIIVQRQISMRRAGYSPTSPQVIDSRIYSIRARALCAGTPPHTESLLRLASGRGPAMSAVSCGVCARSGLLMHFNRQCASSSIKKRSKATWVFTGLADSIHRQLLPSRHGDLMIKCNRKDQASTAVAPGLLVVEQCWMSLVLQAIRHLAQVGAGMPHPTS